MSSDYDKAMEIRREYHEQWLRQKVWAISENDDGTFRVHRHNDGGVAPPHDYPTLRKAAARMLQLLEVGAVAPQTWPERTCIGYVETAKED